MGKRYAEMKLSVSCVCNVVLFLQDQTPESIRDVQTGQ